MAVKLMKYFNSLVVVKNLTFYEVYLIKKL